MSLDVTGATELCVGKKIFHTSLTDVAKKPQSNL